MTAKASLKQLSIVYFLFLLPFSVSAQSYQEQLPRFWQTLYPDGGKTLYCGASFRPYDNMINVEHVFPMAWVAREMGCGDRKQCRENSARFNQIESDMHNLFPVRKTINKARGALPFGELIGENWLEQDCDFEVDEQFKRVEPRPEVRGDIARAMFYMGDRYGLRIANRQVKTLLQWHKDDPPDDEERRRNQLIEQLQGNRNSFIDKPETLR